MTTPTTITELRSTLLQIPWRGAPPAAGVVPSGPREIYMLEIETQGGLVGMSYLQPLRGGLQTIDACMKELIAPQLLGRDATEVEAIWQQLYKSNFWLGRMGVTVFAQSAVDMALWDIVGKRAGLPLFRLWGAARSEVPAYGSGCFRGLGRDGMIARAKEFTAMGLKAIKMQVAHIRPWREDVENVKAMREAMGGGVEIMIDVNMGWDADTAIQAGHRIDEFDPYWLEEPVVAEDFAGYRRIAVALRTRVVGGESHFTRNDLRPFLEAPASVPILQPDPMRGGYSELRKIAAAAEPWAISIAPHLFHEQMVHLLASIPNASYLEYMDWNDDLWIEPIKPNSNGMMIPPERPGHGLAFRPEVLKDHRIGGSRMGTTTSAPVPPGSDALIATPAQIAGGTVAPQGQTPYAGTVVGAESPGGG
jgi:L-alanine-DL-glutamate epimerase-like enolase superfamily enzyme